MGNSSGVYFRRRKLWFSLLVGVALCLHASTDAAAQSEIKAGTELVVQGPAKDAKVNLRAEASAASRVLAELSPDATGITATGRIKRNDADIWIEARFGAQVGWINSRLVRRVQEPSQTDKTHSADPFIDCDSTEPDRRLRGCTTLIERPDLAASTRATAYSRRSDTYIESKDFGRAIADRMEALRLQPDDAQHKARLSAAYHMRGLLYSQKKDYQRAIADYGEAISLEQANHGVFEARALTFAQMGELDKAIEDLSTAVRLDATNTRYAVELASLYERRALKRYLHSEFDGAVADYSEAIKLSQAQPQLLLYRGDAYLAQKDVERALEDYDKVLSLEPSRVDALLRRGQLHLSSNRLDPAIADYTAAIKIEPKNIQPLLFRALALERAKRLEEAAKDYSTALEIQPKNSSAKSNLRRLTAFQTWAASATSSQTQNGGSTTAMQSAAVFGQVGDFVTFGNRDLTGRDVRHLKGIELRACTAACEKNETCQAYTYDKWNSWCSLKSTADELRVSAKAISAVRAGLPEPRHSSLPIEIQRYRGKSFPDGGESTRSANSFEACEQRCQALTSCIAFTFSRTKKQCRLMESAAEYFADKTADSGAKLQAAR